MPAIGSLLYLDLVFLNHYPHIFHYPVKITAEHAPRPYRLAIRRVRVLKCVIVGSFAYLTYATLGNREGLGTFFLLVFLPLTLGSTECFVYRALTKC
ncbi:hypothetical protein [Catalinimonas alkaloidigena]|uniref:hypothetical protein n=1 Tax=Catalinimonas alkaloidigena TaxID=1075417 RepID=UPI001FDEC39D|nr:hypothetical protein [Catalinimonas alkaloidigena]